MSTIFFSYTQDSATHAKLMLDRMDRAVGRAFGEGQVRIADWLSAPHLEGQLMARLSEQIDDSDVFIALICNGYFHGSVAQQEMEYLVQVWDQRPREVYVILTGGHALADWRGFAAQRPVLDQLIYADFAAQPFYGDVHGSFALTSKASDHVDGISKLVVETLRARIAADPIGNLIREAPKTARRSTVFLFGNPEDPLDDPTAETLTETLDALSTAGAEDAVRVLDLRQAKAALGGDSGFDPQEAPVLIHVGDDWDRSKTRLDCENVAEALDLHPAHAVLVGDAALLGDYTGANGAKLAADHLRAIDEVLPEAGEGRSRLAERLLWLPSASRDQAETVAADQDAFKVTQAAAEEMAGTLRSLLGIGHHTDLIVQRTNMRYNEINRWAHSELKAAIQVEAEPYLFDDAHYFLEALRVSCQDGVPILVAIGDRGARLDRVGSRARGLSSRNVAQQAFKQHLRQWEYRMEEVLSEYPQAKVFRLFLQYEHRRVLPAPVEVDGRWWETLKFDDPEAPKPCQHCLETVRQRFHDWYDAVKRQAAHA